MDPTSVTRQRLNSSPVEIRDSRRLCWYAAVFDVPAMVDDFKPGERQRTKFQEVIRPGAFSRSLQMPGEITGTVNHDRKRTFALRSRGELVLQEDKRGLFVSCCLPENPLGDMILAAAEAGQLQGGSFESYVVPGGDVWSDDLCEVVNAPLIDVCIALNDEPAYPTGEPVRIRMADRHKNLFRRLKMLRLKLNNIAQSQQGE